MNGIHDMGGMHGFGAVEVEADEPVFHTRWEARVFGLSLLSTALVGGNTDSFRHAIERVSPVDYLQHGYYGRWLRSMELRLLEAGVLAPGELDARLAGDAIESGPLPEPPPRGLPTARRHRTTEPAFAAGQRVVTRNHQPPGHTRLPAYARSRRGVIASVHPDAWVLPDSNAHGLGERPQPVYSVRFEGSELWGDAAERGTCVHLDLFESYLQPEG